MALPISVRTCGHHRVMGGLASPCYGLSRWPSWYYPLSSSIYNIVSDSHDTDENHYCHSMGTDWRTYRLWLVPSDDILFMHCFNYELLGLLYRLPADFTLSAFSAILCSSLDIVILMHTKYSTSYHLYVPNSVFRNASSAWYGLAIHSNFTGYTTDAHQYRLLVRFALADS